MQLFDLQLSGVLIDTRIWYPTKLIPDLHDRHAWNWCQKHGVGVWAVCHGPTSI